MLMLMDVASSEPELEDPTIRLGGIEPESIVDGPGFRCTIFVQGCTLACPGCHNQPLQEPQSGRIEGVAGIARRYFSNPLLEGITLSGGEPFQQPSSCTILAKEAHQRGLSVFCYSGYTFETLANKDRPDWMKLLESIDVLIDGPYVAAQRDLTLLWRGSKNQRLVDVPASLLTGSAVIWEP